MHNREPLFSIYVVGTFFAYHDDIQKHLFTSVFLISCSENVEKNHKKTPMIEALFSAVGRCSPAKLSTKIIYNNTLHTVVLRIFSELIFFCKTLPGKCMRIF